MLNVTNSIFYLLTHHPFSTAYVIFSTLHCWCSKSSSWSSEAFWLNSERTLATISLMAFGDGAAWDDHWNRGLCTCPMRRYGASRTTPKVWRKERWVEHYFHVFTRCFQKPVSLNKHESGSTNSWLPAVLLYSLQADWRTMICLTLAFALTQIRCLLCTVKLV